MHFCMEIFFRLFYFVVLGSVRFVETSGFVRKVHTKRVLYVFIRKSVCAFGSTLCTKLCGRTSTCTVMAGVHCMRFFFALVGFLLSSTFVREFSFS